MNATTVAVDLAKSVFQLAVADEHWRVVETQRLTRTQFERWFANRQVDLVIMEACGSAHHWTRWLNDLWASKYACYRPSTSAPTSNNNLSWLKWRIDDIRTVQELLGHADMSTTMIYTHVLNKDERPSKCNERADRGVVSPLDKIH